MNRWLALLPVAVFVLVLVGFMAGLRRDPSILPSQLIGKTLPAFDLPPLDAGQTTHLVSANLKGEPMLVNVFASWCVACKEEHPTLLRLKAEGVTIQGLDWKDEAADGARYLAENGDPYLLKGNDHTGRAGIDMGVSGVPETFVLDKQGRVRYRQVGAITPDVWVNTIGPLMAKLRAEIVKRFWALAAIVLALSSPARAVTPDEQLPNPALEARARALSQELRCVVCQNQTIDESDALLAHDLRVILRERIAAGDSDKQAVAFLVARYGDYVMLKPPLQADTLALWLGPLAVLLIGGLGVGLYWRGRAAKLSETPALNPADEAELARLLNTDETG